MLHRAWVVWVNGCRIVTALVFLFSGFVKLNDPLGTYYKLSEYANAFGLSSVVPDSLPFFGSLLMGIFEFLLGVFLFFGIRRRLSSILLLLFMAVMTPLTLYLALANPVPDCGCFGDVLILTNWQTFFKNIVLLVMAVTLVKSPREMVSFISEKSRWLVSLYALLYACALAVYSLFYLPVFDFRPYHITADLKESLMGAQSGKASVLERIYTLEKDGVQQEFTVDDYPDDPDWQFVSERTIVKEEGYDPLAQTGLQLISQATGEEVTEEVLTYPGYTFLLVAYRLEEADDSYSGAINDLYDYSVEGGYPFYALTASNDSVVERWCDYNGAEYPFCRVEEETLKSMIRSNPGLMLLHNGVVVNKWSAHRLPDERQLTGPLEELPLAHIQPTTMRRKLLFVAAWFVGPFFLFVLLDKWLHALLKRQRARRRRKLQQGPKGT